MLLPGDADETSIKVCFRHERGARRLMRLANFLAEFEAPFAGSFVRHPRNAAGGQHLLDHGAVAQTAPKNTARPRKLQDLSRGRWPALTSGLEGSSSSRPVT